MVLEAIISSDKVSEHTLWLFSCTRRSLRAPLTTRRFQTARDRPLITAALFVSSADNTRNSDENGDDHRARQTVAGGNSDLPAHLGTGNMRRRSKDKIQL